MAELLTLFGSKKTKIQLPIPNLKVNPSTKFQHRMRGVIAYAQVTSLKFLVKVFLYLLFQDFVSSLVDPFVCGPNNKAKHLLSEFSAECYSIVQSIRKD
jgi:hypothetical protein